MKMPEIDYHGIGTVEVDPTLEYLYITLPISKLSEREANKLHKKNVHVIVTVEK